MGSKFPYVVHLLNDDVDYELRVRGRKDDLNKPLEEKQKILRRLYREDKLEKKTYASIYAIDQEYDWMVSHIEKLRAFLEKDPQPKYISRLRYFYMRANRSNTTTEQSEGLKKSILATISELLTIYDVNESETDSDKSDGESNDKDKDKDNKLKLQELQAKEEELKKKEEDIKRKEQELKEKQKQQKPFDQTQFETAVMEAVKKMFAGPLPFPNTKPLTIPSQQTTQEELARTELTKQVKTLEKQLQQMKDKMSQMGRQNNNQGVVTAELLAQALSTLQTSQNQIPNQTQGNLDPQNNPNQNPNGNQYPPIPPNPPNSTDIFLDPEEENSSEEDSQIDWTTNSGRESGRTHYDRRIEKWNIYFSADSRSITIEDFIYRIKVLANMNQISKQRLLSHVHMLLRGEASNWFFTYFHPSWDWDMFEIQIRFRFGNPNQEQGTRQSIYNCKQQKGEKFVAFVDEIERLNKLLTKPLSRQRKFETIWENMHAHYRLQLAPFTIQTLEQLKALNQRIDANDPSLNQKGTKHAVHNLETSSDHAGSDEEEVNAIYKKPHGRGSQSQPSNRNETTRLPICWNCRNQGHFWRQCSERKTTFCYICGNPGTVAATCDKHPKKEPTGQTGDPSGNQDRNA